MVCVFGSVSLVLRPPLRVRRDPDLPSGSNQVQYQLVQTDMHMHISMHMTYSYAYYLSSTYYVRMQYAYLLASTSKHLPPIPPSPETPEPPS